MTIWYADSNALTVGDGSADAPYQTVAEISPADGDTIRLAGGSIFREQVGSARIGFNNITVEAYGDGDKPIITGADIVTDWTDLGGGIYSHSIGSNLGGNVSEDGSPMVWRRWVTNIATVNLLPGEFCYDPTGFVIYIRPSSGTASSHSYGVSKRLYGMVSLSTKSGLIIRDVDIRQASRHGLYIQNVSNWLFERIDISLAGGIKEGAYYLGDAIDVAANCDNGICRDSTFRHLFDGGPSTQCGSGSAATSNNHLYERNLVEYAGLHGIMIAAQTANNVVSNFVVRKNTVRYIGDYGWMARRDDVSAPGGIGCKSSAAAGSLVSGVIEGNIAENQKTARTTGYGLFTILDGGGTVRFTGNVARGEMRRGFASNGTSKAHTAIFTSNVVDASGGVAFEVSGTNPATVTCTHNVLAGADTGVRLVNPSGGLTVKNTAIVNNGAAFAVTGGTLTETHNSVHGNAAVGITLDVSDKTEYPMLSENWRLLPGSPLLKAGTHLGYSRDIDGVRRPNPPSIGAYDVATLRRVD